MNPTPHDRPRTPTGCESADELKETGQRESFRTLTNDFRTVKVRLSEQNRNAVFWRWVFILWLMLISLGIISIATQTAWV